MQLKITLSGNKIRLPLAASSILQGFIYNALTDNLSFSRQLHDEGYAFEQRRFKLFSFGELRGKYEVTGKEMIFSNKAVLEIRSVDPYMIQLLYSYFLQNKTAMLGENKIDITNLTIDNKTIFTDNLRIKTLSPITVYSTADNRHTTYHSPEEENFYAAIIGNAKRKWRSIFSEVSDFDLTICPVENPRYIKRVTNFKSTLITAWHGEFYLNGSAEILNFLYNTGIGSKNSQGFGMFKII